MQVVNPLARKEAAVSLLRIHSWCRHCGSCKLQGITSRRASSVAAFVTKWMVGVAQQDDAIALVGWEPRPQWATGVI